MKQYSDEQLVARFNALYERGDDEAIMAFIAEVDAADASREARLSAPGALTSAAVWYATNGIAVFPLMPRDKKPYPGSRGFKDATTDVARVRAWWAKHPDSNIGLPTGQTFDVIDIDGPPGFASLADLREQGMLPELLGKAWTPGDPDKALPNAPGRHLYIAPTGDGNTSKVLPGVDYRGLGGYVLAPPSVGKNGRRYDWIEPLNIGVLARAAA